MSDPRIISSEKLFQATRTLLRLDRVQLPEGRVVEREIVESQDAVCVVALDGDGNVLMVRQYRVPVHQTLLELPAGGVEQGEEPLACARRELREETGFAASELTPIGDFWTIPGFGTERMYVFLATGLRPDPLPADEDEDIEMERVPIAQALEMARSGHLHDAKTIAALALAERHLVR